MFFLLNLQAKMLILTYPHQSVHLLSTNKSHLLEKHQSAVFEFH